jgi:hypothetical protein
MTILYVYLKGYNTVNIDKQLGAARHSESCRAEWLLVVAGSSSQAKRAEFPRYGRRAPRYGLPATSN